MSDLVVATKFAFITNKSFLASGQRPITIPASSCQELKRHALTETIPVIIKFRNDAIIEGAIRVGWRAGGKYYQITMSKSHALNDIPMGQRLLVKVINKSTEWMVEID